MLGILLGACDAQKENATNGYTAQAKTAYLGRCQPVVKATDDALAEIQEYIIQGGASTSFVASLSCLRILSVVGGAVGEVPAESWLFFAGGKAGRAAATRVQPRKSARP